MRVPLESSSGGGGSDGGCGVEWSCHVAVLVPGSPSHVAGQLIAAVRHAAAASDTADPNIRAVADALPVITRGGEGGAPAQYGQTGLYFGPSENFAGLERPFVIVTGMQHPDYLIYKKDAEGWQMEEIVDPRVYLAVTRCTLELSIVEAGVRKFAAHFKVSNVASTAGSTGDRLATFAGASVYAAQPVHAWVEAAPTDAHGLRFVRVGVTVDLADPPQEEDLESAVVLTVEQLDRRLWEATL